MTFIFFLVGGLTTGFKVRARLLLLGVGLLLGQLLLAPGSVATLFSAVLFTLTPLLAVLTGLATGRRPCC